MRVNKKIFRLLLIFAFLFLFTYKVNAVNLNYKNEETNYELAIEDDANLLSDVEIRKLRDIMEPLTEYGNIIFKSIDQNYTTASNYAREYYHNSFGTSSGTIFLIDMYTRMIYIFSDGFNYTVITNSKAEIITDNIYRYASNMEYYECAEKAFNQINTLLDGGKIAEPMRYISNILISISSAFLICFLFVLSYTKIKKATASEILKNCNISFDVNSVSGKLIGTHRVYSPVSDSSSSGGGSSGGGGGGSSGGGGGHSF